MECSSGPIIIRLFSKDSATLNSIMRQDTNFSDINDKLRAEEYKKEKEGNCRVGIFQECKPSVKKKDPDWNATIAKRKFLNAWKSLFPFLDYNFRKKVMFCKICHQYSTSKQKKLPFVRGTKNFKLSTVKFHQTSSLHSKCLKLAAQKINGVNSFEHDMQKKRVVSIFKLVYFMVKSKSSFTSFPQLCADQKKLNLDLGHAYTTHHKVVTSFSKFIASNIEKDISEKIKNIRMFSLVLDRSFSRGTESHEMVYLKYVDGASVKTIFLGVVQSKGVDAKDMFENLSKLFERFGLKQWTQMLVFIMVDFSKTRSWIDGLVALIKDNSSHIFVGMIPLLSHKIHHFHRISKIFSSKNELLETISSIYQYYYSLQVENRTLTNLDKELDSIIEDYGELPKKPSMVPINLNTLEAVDKDWCLLVEHLRQKDVNLESKHGKDRRNILSSITKLSFILNLGLYLDVFRSVSNFGKTLEDDCFLPYNFSTSLGNFSDNLKSACNGKENVFQQYLSDLNLACSTFRNIFINLDRNKDFVCKDAQKQFQPLIHYFNDKVLDRVAYLNCTKILDFESLRTQKNMENSLSEFSNCFLHFQNKAESLQLALREWNDFSSRITPIFASENTSHIRTFLLQAIHKYHDDFPIVTDILKKTVLLDFHSEIMRRGYKEMNLIKSVERSSLSVNSLQASMMIVMHGPPFSELFHIKTETSKDQLVEDEEVLDRSFSRGTESHEMVNLKYVDGASVKTIFLGVVQSKGVDAKDMFENLSKLFERFGLKQWSQMVVFIMVDFSKTRSWIDGLVALIKDNSSHIFVGMIPLLPLKIHHFHRISKIFSSKNELLETISSIYQYYYSLQVENRTLTNLDKELDSIIEDYGELPKKPSMVPINLNTLEAVDKDWCLLVEHLRQKDVNLDSKHVILIDFHGF
ncbi:zinc finger protein 862 [Parasteatoda tepidariorum]|uniref:zinc finger protein 862 n=1 Tax=Parasteatoda tepidariorum TaxID=114398 RepID=UPI0039BCBC2C